MDAKSVDTTLSITNFIASDIDKIVAQEAQKDFRDFLNPMVIDFIENCEISHTILDSNNEIVTIFGTIPSNDVGIVWAVHSDLFKKYAREVTRSVRGMMDVLLEDGIYKSLKGSVIDGFEAGHRWMKILKFQRGDLHEAGYYEYERTV